MYKNIIFNFFFTNSDYFFLFFFSLKESNPRSPNLFLFFIHMFHSSLKQVVFILDKFFFFYLGIFWGV